LLAFLIASLLIAGCGGDQTGAAAPETTALASSTSLDAPSMSTSTSTSIATSTSTSITIDVEPTVDDGCRRIADLEREDELRRWRVVNDGVMGGRSSADTEIERSVLTVEGEIVTDGGGFSSIRLHLDEPIGDATSLRFRIRTDGRQYELTASDAADGRDPRISHQGPIPANGGDDWEEIEVDLATLESSIFGQSVSTDPFDPTTAVEVGIILADGADGPFRFELDWISVCP